MRRILSALLIALSLLIIISPSVEAAEVKNFIKLNEPRDNFMTSSSRVLITGETVPETNVVVLVNGRKRAESFRWELRAFL